MNCEVESSVKRIAAILVATAFAGLVGCAVSVPENAFLYPDARIAAEKIDLKPGPALPDTAQSQSIAYPGGHPVRLSWLRSVDGRFRYRFNEGRRRHSDPRPRNR